MRSSVCVCVLLSFLSSLLLLLYLLVLSSLLLLLLFVIVCIVIVVVVVVCGVGGVYQERSSAVWEASCSKNDEQNKSSQNQLRATHDQREEAHATARSPIHGRTTQSISGQQHVVFAHPICGWDSSVCVGGSACGSSCNGFACGVACGDATACGEAHCYSNVFGVGAYARSWNCS